MISLVYSYYRNPQMLARHLEEWSRYPPWVKARIRAIIVDDGSPEPARIESDPGFEVRLYRILVNIRWNQSGARNLALMETPDDWVLMTDMDHLLRADHAAAMLLMSVKPGVGYRPRRLRKGKVYKRHVLSMLMRKADYWACGGMDEDFAGHYGEGTPFMRNFAAVACVIDTDEFALTLIGRSQVEDARTTEFGRFGSDDDANLVPALSAKRKGEAYKAVDPIRFPWERVQ